jgi:class 3 adenylate cyclase/CheY-like chemotaxis protein
MSRRDELLTLVTLVSQRSARLLADVKDLSRPDFLADLHKVHDASGQLAEMIRTALAPGAPAERIESSTRHAMLNTLNPVINYCELWLEEAKEHFLEAFLADLRLIHETGKQCMTIVSRLGKEAEAKPVETALAEEDDGDSDSVYNVPKPGSLLIVDDNADNRDILARLLVQQRHRVATAADGLQALKMLQAQAFDVVLLDMVMPQMDGYKVLRTIKKDAQLRNIPVIMISALDEIDRVARCIERGAEDYLPKPVNPVVLRARLNSCLEKKRFRDKEAAYLDEIEKERKRSDTLLHVILPKTIVKELKTSGHVKPRRHENVAVLFADIVGFTSYCDQRPPEEVVKYLQQLVEDWEVLAGRHQVDKIKTIGDAFMAVAGLLRSVPSPVLQCVRFGLEMFAVLQRLPTKWDVRVGIHAGPVVAGILGRRQYQFDLWGDTVNTAARMESNGVPGAVTLSSEAWKQIADQARGESLGVVPVKGKGELEIIKFIEFTR